MKNRDKNRFKLDDIEKMNPFNVPEGYFEDFSSRMKSQIRHEEKPVIRGIWSRYRLLPAAAAVIGLMIIVFAGIRLTITDKNVPVEMGISEVIDNNINDFDDTQLFEIYSKSFGSSGDQENNQENIDVMINYILYSGTDINYIMNDI